MNDFFGFVITLVYIFALIAAAEGLRRWRGLPSDFTRKVVHIGVGMVMWALPWLFSTPWPFVAACAGFMLLNFLDWKYGFFAAMASTDRSNLGTVYFPFAAGVCALLFWDRPRLMIAALMPLTWGDGLAPVVGRAVGWGRYTVAGHTRTLAGSLTFFAAAWVWTALALWLPPGPPEMAFITAVRTAALVAGLTALVEAVSVRGVDNLTVTAAAIALLWRG